MKLLFLSSLFFLFQPNLPGQPSVEKTGTVIKIVDGDTFDLLTRDKGTLRVRMYGIDSPERRQDFYRAAKNALGSFIFKRNIRIKITGQDRNRRIIAMVYCNDRNINLAMIKSGFAWHFKKYADDPGFAKAEKQARLAKIGLWKKAGAIAPWEFRKQRHAHSNAIQQSLVATTYL